MNESYYALSVAPPSTTPPEPYRPRGPDDRWPRLIRAGEPIPFGAALVQPGPR